MKGKLLAATSALAILVGTAGAHATTFDYTDGLQEYVVPTTGLYDITAAGAQGGGSRDADGLSAAGGLGATVEAEGILDAGQFLFIVAGGEGQSETGSGAGGGGFSGVVLSVGGPVLIPVVIAGGGGGAGFYTSAGGPGQSGPNGHAGIGSNGGAGGTGSSVSGQGGTYAAGGNGGGGAGWDGPNGNAGTGPMSGTGGYFYGGYGGGGGGRGGFGGGGGGGYNGGGGGGGYNGGGGGGAYSTGELSTGSGGGGGGSYVFPFLTTISDVGGVNAGYGYVTIDPVPEPGTLGLFGAALAAFGFRRKKRKLG